MRKVVLGAAFDFGVRYPVWFVGEFIWKPLARKFDGNLYDWED